MIGGIAASKASDLFSKLVLVAPSPCYIDDGDYVGGFTRAQIDELLEALDTNPLGWSMTMAPVIMGKPIPAEALAQLFEPFKREETRQSQNAWAWAFI